MPRFGPLTPRRAVACFLGSFGSWRKCRIWFWFNWLGRDTKVIVGFEGLETTENEIQNRSESLES